MTQPETIPRLDATGRTGGPQPIALLLAALGLAAAGTALARHLLDEHLEVYRGGVAEGLFCGGTASLACTAVASHPAAWVLGLPTAGWGLIYYVVTLCLVACAILLRGPERKALCLVALSINAAALGADVLLLILMLAEVRAVCLNCLAAHLITLGLTFCLGRAARTLPGPGSLDSLLVSPRALLRDVGGSYYQALTKLGLAMITVYATTVAAASVSRSSAALVRFSQTEAERFFADSNTTPRVPMDLFDGQPARGRSAARLQVALFGDFQCPYCRGLARELSAIGKATGELREYFVNHPLDSRCNRLVRSGDHRDACWLAAVAECAHQQGRFWDAHDLLFARGSPSRVDRASLLAQLARAGLDTARLQSCLDSGDGVHAVESDVALNQRLGIRRVPSLVVNGHVWRGGMLPGTLRQIVHTVLQGDSARHVQEEEPPAAVAAEDAGS